MRPAVCVCVGVAVLRALDSRRNLLLLVPTVMSIEPNPAVSLLYGSPLGSIAGDDSTGGFDLLAAVYFPTSRCFVKAWSDEQCEKSHSRLRVLVLVVATQSTCKAHGVLWRAGLSRTGFPCERGCWQLVSNTSGCGVALLTKEEPEKGDAE